MDEAESGTPTDQKNICVCARTTQTKDRYPRPGPINEYGGEGLGVRGTDSLSDPIRNQESQTALDWNNPHATT